MHGCGNTFVLIDEYNGELIKNTEKKNYVIKVADKNNVDGVLFLTKSDEADIGMQFYDRDGTKETMCGNGIRCFTRYAFDKGYIKNNARILTGDGIKKVELSEGVVSVNMGAARYFKQIDYYYFAFTGVPHIVIFVDKLNKKEAFERGRKLRYDKTLCSLLGHKEGININFVKKLSKNELKILTYEVGVENLTKACGTGSTAATFISSKVKNCTFPMKVHNIGGLLTINKKNNELILSGNAEYF